MKKQFFSILALFLALSARSQSCLPDGITFSTQAEVDNFPLDYPGCTEVEGDLEIFGADIHDLSGLSGLSSIGGFFRIYNIPSIANLEGLNNLGSVGGSFYLDNNYALTDITALNNLQTIGGDFEIVGNPELTNLSGLGSLATIGGWLALDDTALSDLNGLGQLSSVGGNLLIRYNGVLTSLAGLNNLQAVGGEVEIQGNEILPDMNGLAGLTSIGGNLLIDGNNSLLHFTGLSNLRTVGKGFVVSNNPALQHFSGLDSLRTIGDSLFVLSNPSLIDLGGMAWLDSIGGKLHLKYNNALTNFGNFGHLSYIGGHFILESNPLLAQLAGLEQLVTIGGNFSIGNVVTSLQGLDNLTSIGGDFRVTPSLMGFSGVDNLTNIGGSLTIISNYHLANFNGLNQLTTVGGDVYFNILPQSASLSGLESLTTIGGDLRLDNQSGLTSVQELVSLTSIGGSLSFPYTLESFAGLEMLQTIGGSLAIEGCWYLEDFSGLDNLTSIGGSLFVRVAPVFTSFHGLEKLDSIGGFLRIEDNPELATLEGLDNLTFIGGPDLFVTGNPQLSDCAIYAVCNALFVNDPNLTIAIGQNGPGCATPQEARASCHTIPVEATVRIDTNGDCLPDVSDTPAEGIQVRLSGNGQVALRPGDQNGVSLFQYFNSGPFTLSLPQYPSANWAVCQDDILITPGTPFIQDTLKATFLLSPLQQECAELTVELGLPSIFRSCLVASDLEVSVKNTGSVIAESVILAVVKPLEMDLLSSNPPLSAQSGDTLYFELGDLAPLADSIVKIKVKTNCNFFLFEHTLCFEAFARTLIPCQATFPPASEIKLSAQCLGDTTVRFTLKNIGNAPTQNPHEYVILRNEEVLDKENFNLNAQQSMFVDFPADAATYRMEATKFDDGTLTATAIENCGGLTPGLITSFWLDKGPIDYDFDCREVLGSFDPNQKTAVPAGTGAEHAIVPNRSLEYTIDFQNTGTDTAFRVLLRDVLPQQLDINTFRPGFASHPYTWEIRGADTLEVLFFPIMLPDSNVNEPASHGFFSFTMDQKPDLQDGQTLENKASIIFDFNPPIVTNTVLHTIRELLIVSVDGPQVQPPLWRVLGNPTHDVATFQATAFMAGSKRFELYDAAGRLLRSVPFEGQQFDFQRDGLPEGLYFFRISDLQGKSFTGKIVMGG
ncbi:MAG: hypothetical protein H6566_07810 [Lewinellaceae bacterium]|nr:hypothetical protein [Lewinellaceae bacterium]